MFDEFTTTSLIALHSILISEIASAIIMHLVKSFWHKWLYSILLSMIIITCLSFIAGFTGEAFAYILFVGFGGVFTETLVLFFQKIEV